MGNFCSKETVPEVHQLAQNIEDNIIEQPYDGNELNSDTKNNDKFIGYPKLKALQQTMELVMGFRKKQTLLEFEEDLRKDEKSVQNYADFLDSQISRTKSQDMKYLIVEVQRANLHIKPEYLMEQLNRVKIIIQVKSQEDQELFHLRETNWNLNTRNPEWDFCKRIKLNQQSKIWQIGDQFATTYFTLQLVINDQDSGHSSLGSVQQIGFSELFDQTIKEQILRVKTGSAEKIAAHIKIKVQLIHNYAECLQNIKLSMEIWRKQIQYFTNTIENIKKDKHVDLNENLNLDLTQLEEQSDQVDRPSARPSEIFDLPFYIEEKNK